MKKESLFKSKGGFLTVSSKYEEKLKNFSSKLKESTKSGTKFIGKMLQKRKRSEDPRKKTEMMDFQLNIRDSKISSKRTDKMDDITEEAYSGINLSKVDGTEMAISGFFEGGKLTKKQRIQMEKEEKYQEKQMIKERRTAYQNKRDWQKQYSKMSSNQKEDQFLGLMDEKTKLKMQNLKMQQEMKKLKVQVNKVESMAFTYDRKMKRMFNQTGESERFDEISKLERSVRLLKQQKKDQKKKMKHMQSMIGKRAQTSKGRTPTHRSIVNTVQQQIQPSHNKTKLLQTIDQLKRQLFKTNDKVKRLQSNLSKSRAQGGGVAVSELQEKDVAMTQLKGRLQSQVMSNEALQKRYEKGQDKLKELNMLLNDTKKDKIALERENLSLRNSSAQVHQLEEQLKDQKNSYKMLQAQFDDLCDSPFSDNDGPKVTRHEMSELSNQIMKLKNDLSAETKQKEILEDQNKKLNAKFEKLELKMEKKQDQLNELKVEAMEKTKSLGTYKRQMDILNLDNKLDQDLFHKVLAQVKWQGEEPAWHRVEFIERTHEINWNDTGSLKKEINRLRTEKGQIAAQLQQQETQIRLMMEMQNEKSHLHEVEIKRLNLTIKSHELRIQELIRTAEYSTQAKFSRERDTHKLQTIGETDGIIYDKPTSVFSDEEDQDIEPGFNILDIWLGEAEYEPSQLLKTKVFSDEVGHELQTLVTSDFYNFDTESSGICEGLKTNYNLQISYKVQVDQYIIKYFKQHSISIEVFVSAGLDIHKIGYGQIPLKDLIELNTGMDQHQSAVIDKNINVIGVNKEEMIGKIRFKARMRNPISQLLKQLRDQEILGIDTTTYKQDVLDVGERMRVLHVSITKSQGLPKDVKSFVTYKFFNEQDEFTKAIFGSNPQYNFIQKHELKQDSDLNQYLQVSSLEFQVFDDDIPIMPVTSTQEEDSMPQDFIGKAKIQLYPLTKNKMINTDLSILNAKNKTVGTLHIKIYWKDYKEPFRDRIEDAEMTKNWEFQTTKKIADSIKVRELGITAAFNIFDYDRDQEISFGDFKYTIQETFQLGISDDELVLYWRKIFADRPTSNKNMTKKEFIQKFHNLVGKHQEENLVEINRIINEHDKDWDSRRESTQQGSKVKKVQREVASVVSIMIRTKSMKLSDVFDDISRYKEKFSIYEFASWLQKHSVFLSGDEKQQLLNHYDTNRDGMISRREFNQGITPYLSSDVRKGESTQIHRMDTDDLITEVKNDVWYYMKDNDVNYYELFMEIDKEQQGKISKQDLKNWLSKRLSLNLSRQKLENLMNYFDSDQDGSISMSELRKKLTKRSNKSTRSQRESRPSIKILGKDQINAMNAAVKIVQHLKRKKKSIQDWFLECDIKSDGMITRKEIKRYVNNHFDIKLSPDEIVDLCTYLDCNCDDEISIRELKIVFEPLMKKNDLTLIKQPEKSLTAKQKKKKEEIMKKIKAKIVENRIQIEHLFGYKEISGQRDFITVKNFEVVLREVNQSFKLKMSKDELNAITEIMIEKTKQGWMNYKKFLKLFGEGGEKKKLSYKQKMEKDKLKDKRITRVLKNIKETLISKNIKYKTAFKKFDLDGDKRINSKEFKYLLTPLTHFLQRKSFKMMQIELSDSDIDYLIAKYDSKHSGYIMYEDFIEAFENL